MLMTRIALAIVTLLLSTFAGVARADIADTFNMKELGRSYAMSCPEQAARRHENLAPPYFPGRPQAFLNPSDALVIYSPQLTAEERGKAGKLFASLPSYALPIAWRGG